MLERWQEIPCRTRQLREVLFQVGAEFLLRHERFSRGVPIAVEQVAVRVRAEVVAFRTHAGDERGESSVRQENTGQEERPVRVMPREFVEDRLRALRITVAGENEGDAPCLFGAANNSALPQLATRRPGGPDFRLRRVAADQRQNRKQGKQCCGCVPAHALTLAQRSFAGAARVFEWISSGVGRMTSWATSA